MATVMSPPPVAAEVRSALRLHLEGAGTATLVEEFWVPRSNERADLVAIRDLLEAFEIKSGRDRLNRLPRQVAAYSRLFDACTAVVAEHHATTVRHTIPEWWGIAIIDTRDCAISFEWLRSSDMNPDVDVETLVRLLWRDEVRRVLIELGAPPDPQRGRTWMWQDLLERVDSHALRFLVREAIAMRDPARARMATRRFAVSSVVPQH